MPSREASADIAIGGITVALHTSDPSFVDSLQQRYAGFLGSGRNADFELDLELTPPAEASPDEDVRVYRDRGLWKLERGDFRAEWDPHARRGRVRQSANPYSLDTVLRIVHTLVLAQEGGFLLHASSAVRGGRAYVFSGRSGVGKTTIARLAPPDVALLTDEISYVRKEGDGYSAYGTPFAGELARPGENIRAPLAAVYLLAQGPYNRIEPLPPAEAVRGLLANILFFAQDRELVQAVFRSAMDFAARVPISRLTFRPESAVWDLIGRL